MNKHVFLLCIILLLSSASIGIDLLEVPAREGFKNPGDYPVSVEKPLLRGFYREKKNPRVSTNEAADIYKNYPIFPASSTKNNNIRYWTQPSNGTCNPAVFCDTMYKKTKQVIPPPPLAPLWDSGNVRVNFYDTSKK
tara:strand:+ start:3857 stop:4267 length:411 start_codon:yes stop_codon:yes gene_type:complete